MIYTARIREAIRTAVAAHRGQMRKDGKTSYVVHPLAVGLILSGLGQGEDVIIAGLLHDVVEDTDVTLDDIRRRFGGKVAGLVDELTDRGEGLPWDERKRMQRDRIKSLSREAQVIKSADVLYNMHDSLGMYRQMGDRWFGSASRRKKVLAHYSMRFEELRKAWKGNPLLPELGEVISELLGHRPDRR